MPRPIMDQQAAVGTALSRVRSRMMRSFFFVAPVVIVGGELVVAQFDKRLMCGGLFRLFLTRPHADAYCVVPMRAATSKHLLWSGPCSSSSR